MFTRSRRTGDRVEKASRQKKSFKDPSKLSKLQKSFEESPPIGV